MAQGTFVTLAENESSATIVQSFVCRPLTTPETYVLDNTPPDPRDRRVYGRASRPDARVDWLAMQLGILIEHAEAGEPCPQLLAPPPPRKKAAAK